MTSAFASLDDAYALDEVVKPSEGLVVDIERKLAQLVSREDDCVPLLRGCRSLVDRASVNTRPRDQQVVNDAGRRGVRREDDRRSSSSSRHGLPASSSAHALTWKPMKPV